MNIFYALYSRICDKRRAPRRFWWPADEKITFKDMDSWQRQHDEVSSTIRRIMMVIIAYCLFCVLTLGAPDINLITRNANITVPFADTDVSYKGFLIVGPLILIGFWCYLQIFLAHLDKLTPNSAGTALPFIFNLPGSTARFVSDLILTWLVPFTLLIFAWKAAPHVYSEWLLVLAELVLLIAIFLKIRRLNKRDTENSQANVPDAHYVFLWLLLLFLTILIVFVPVSPDFRLHRSLNLYKADLQSTDLEGVNLKGAILTRANLEDAVLAKANLRDAMLQSSNLHSANLQHANLMHANLIDANLRSTRLNGANMTGANLQGVNLTNAHLYNTNLAGANLKGANMSSAYAEGVNLEGANLDEANLAAGLINANLMNTSLKSTNFESSILNGANLTGLDLKNKILQFLDMRNALLKDADLEGANLERSNLTNANLQGANLKDTILKYTNLTNTNLQGVRNLTCHELIKARNWETSRRDKQLECDKN